MRSRQSDNAWPTAAARPLAVEDGLADTQARTRTRIEFLVAAQFEETTWWARAYSHLLPIGGHVKSPTSLISMTLKWFQTRHTNNLCLAAASAADP